ncbi:WD40 repeat-like protein [Wallemia mellicola]|uniref:WD40 repeat-like protein n=1 Tax=Wallemia mellicola TaxID=1708541 RepID=A0A4T0NP34_9BASI|nr:WD40 repeat-like protein [Wallemia mellicola]
MILDGHSEPILDLAICPYDSSIIATASGKLNFNINRKDSTVRLWKGDRDSYKSYKAIVNFEDAVVAVLWHPKVENQLFLCCGGTIFLFDLNISSPLIKASEVSKTWNVTEVEINSISIDRKAQQVAFCDDSGAVGVLDTSTGKTRLFRYKHANIASKVAYKNGKDGDLLSGSYDSSALIWNTSKGTIGDTLDLSTRQGQSMAPAFVLSLASSEDGKKLAVGSGNGSVWLSSSRLSNAREVTAHNGPVVGLAFVNGRLISCSLYQLCIWKENLEGVDSTTTIDGLEKANCIATTSTHVYIGGFEKNGKGRAVVLPLSL